MTLFLEHPVRSTVGLTLSLAAGWLIAQISTYIYTVQLIQTSVAILAIAATIVLVAMHHRKEGHLLTQTQEEMVLIGCFALFWIALMLAWSTFRTRSNTSDLGASAALSVSSPSARDSDRAPERRTGGYTAGTRPVPPYPCQRDDVYCFVEDVTFY